MQVRIQVAGSGYSAGQVIELDAEAARRMIKAGVAAPIDQEAKGVFRREVMATKEEAASRPGVYRV